MLKTLLWCQPMWGLYTSWPSTLQPLPRIVFKNFVSWDFSGGPVVKNPPSNAGDASSIPGQGTKIPISFGAAKPLQHKEDPVHPNKQTTITFVLWPAPWRWSEDAIPHLPRVLSPKLSDVSFSTNTHLLSIGLSSAEQLNLVSVHLDKGVQNFTPLGG